MSRIEPRFEYRPRMTVIVATVLFFGACAVVIGMKAASNDRGLVIDRLIELGPEGATIFYWACAAASLAFVAVAGLMLIVRVKVRQRITLTEDAVVVPRSRWSNEERTIPFQDIIELRDITTAGQKFLKITHPDGKFMLIASMLPGAEDFEFLTSEITARVEAARPQS